MKLHTLSNDFHNTSVRVRAGAETYLDGQFLVLSDRQVARADRALCGMADCTCGGIHRNHYVEPVEDGCHRVAVA